MRSVFLLMLLLLAPLAFAQEQTTIHFQSASSVPVFKIDELLIENSGNHLSSDITIIEKRMKLLVISPASIQLPNGNVLLNIGGENDFNKTISLNLRGKPFTISSWGNKDTTMIYTVVAVSSLMAFILSIRNVDDSANFNSFAGGVKVTLPVVFAAATVAGGLGIVWNYPRVEIREEP